jgi:hypothetical protein
LVLFYFFRALPVLIPITPVDFAKTFDFRLCGNGPLAITFGTVVRQNPHYYDLLVIVVQYLVMKIATTIISIAIILLLTLSLSVPSFLQNVLAQEQQVKRPPIVNAGPDQMVNEGDRVILNGTGSFDPDGEIVSYAWGVEDSDDEAPPVSLNGQNTYIATFTAPKVAGDVSANSYLFELTVTDNDGLIGSNASKVVVGKGIGQ